MKKILLIMIAVMGITLFAAAQNLNDYRSVAGGTNTWSTLANWQRWNGAWVTPTAGEGYPGQFNSPGLVTIVDNHIFSLNVSPSNPIGALTIQGGGNSTTLTINATFTLDVSGAITYGAPTDATSDKIIALAASTSVLNCGSIIMPDLVTANDNTILNVNDGTVEVNGNITMSANAADENVVDVNLGTLKISGSFSTTGDFILINGSTIEYDGAAQTVRGTTYSNLVLSGTGVKTTTGVTVVDKLTVSGTATVGNVVTYSTAILEYGGGSAQTTSVNEFPASTANITEVIINKSAGTVTLDAAKTLNGNLTLTAGTLAAGNNLTMGAGGTPVITVDAGSITGTLQGLNDYEVNYTGISKTTGAELSGSGLLNVDLNLDAGTDVVTLDQNRSPDGDVTLNDGVLNLSTFTLNRSVAGGSFNITNNSTLRIGGTNSFPSNYNVHNVTNGAPFTATVEYSGTAQTVTDLAGGDNFVNLILSGSGVKTLAAGIAVDVLLSIQGTATTAGTTPTYNTAILEYKGSSPQNTSNVEFPAAITANLIIDNAGGVTLNGPKTLSGTLTLTSGVLTTTLANILIMPDGFFTVNGVSNSSYVDGPVRKIGNDDFTFPVGDPLSGYHRLRLVNTAGGSINGTNTDSYTAEYVRASASALGTVSSPLFGVSNCEYWTLLRDAGTSTPNLFVSWTDNSDCSGNQYVTSLTGLTVARLNSGVWGLANGTNQAATGSVGLSGDGNVADNGISAFGTFALGNTAAELNPLPVTFSDVKAFEKGTGVQIEWSNLTEKDVVNYIVERSANGNDFVAIGQLNARSNQTDKQSYVSLDANPFAGTNFYRIKVVELDGKVIYSKMLRVEIGRTVKGITLYPNPVTSGEVTIGFTAVKGMYTLRIMNAAGQQISAKQIVHPGGNVSQAVTIPASVKSGFYVMTISGENFKESKTFVIQ